MGEHSVTMQFALFRDDSPQVDEETLWAEEREVPVVDGAFQVLLGDAGGTPVPGAKVNDLGYAFRAGAAYLQITLISGPGIESPEVFLPREELHPATFALQSFHGVPPGSIMPYAGTVAPEGWLLCNGAPLDGDDPEFRALFEAIGQQFGAGEGNTFFLPDLTGRLPVGVNEAPESTPFALGETHGNAFHTLSTAEMPAHTHPTWPQDHSHRLRSPSRNLVDRSNAIAWEFVIDYSGSSSDPNNQRKTSPAKMNIAEDMVGGDPPAAFPLSQPGLGVNFIIKK